MKKYVIALALVMGLLAVAVIYILYNSPSRKARGYIDGWDDMGMYLPENQISFFSENFYEVKEILSGCLINSNSDIRQRAAYVIEGLGPQAKSLEKNILYALKMESDRTLRLYYYDALRSIRASDSTTLFYLKNRFQILLTQQDDSSDEEFYKVSDERISLAAALFIIDDDLEQRPNYLNEVLQWLKPSSSTLSPTELETYWDHRWIAVIAVEYMQGAEEAIPLLEEMLTEQSAKEWVSIHVPRALNALREDSTLK